MPFLILCHEGASTLEISLNDRIRVLWKLVLDEVGPLLVRDWGHCVCFGVEFRICGPLVVLEEDRRKNSDHSTAGSAPGFSACCFVFG